MEKQRAAIISLFTVPIAMFMPTIVMAQYPSQYIPMNIINVATQKKINTYKEDYFEIDSRVGDSTMVSMDRLPFGVVIAPNTPPVQLISRQNVDYDSITHSYHKPKMVKGFVVSTYIHGDSFDIDEAFGANVINRTTSHGVAVNLDGEFEIEASKGDIIQISMMGYACKEIVIEDPSEPLAIVLDDYNPEQYPPIVAVIDSYPCKPTGTLDLEIVDENGSPIDYEDLVVYWVYIDENGEEDEEDFIGSNVIRIWWSDIIVDKDTAVPLKEATFRIEAKGYKPIVREFKFPKKYTRKTIKFKEKLKL